MGRELDKKQQAIIEDLEKHGKTSLSGLAFDLHHNKVIIFKNHDAADANVSRMVSRLEELG